MLRLFLFLVIWTGSLALGEAVSLSLPDQKEPHSYAVEYWEMKDGLPLNKVRAVTQTLDGYLWVGTFNGLARFDGVHFKVFDVKNTPALQDNAIDSLCEDQIGRLWIGNDLGGISVLTGGQFYPVKLPASWPARPVLCLASDADGTVWAMNDLGNLLPLNNGVAGKPFLCIASPIALPMDHSGQVWAAVGGHLCRLEREQGPVRVNPEPKTAKGWRAIFAAQAGGLWILEGDWLRRWDRGGWKEDRGHHNWDGILLPAFLESRAGVIFGGSFRNGIEVLNRAGDTEQVDEAQGLSQNWAYCLCEDREGNIWAGTGNGGLNVLRSRRVTMFNAPDNWRSCAVLSIAPAATGGLWIGTEGAGVYRMLGGVIQPVSTNQGFWQSVDNAVMESRAGQLWVGTWGSGVQQLESEPAGFQRVSPASGSRGIVFTVFEASDGDVWVGTRGGPGRWRQGHWNWLDTPGSLTNSAVRCFAETTDGSLWFGCDGGGVWRLQDGSLKQFTTTDGLLNNYVRTMHATADGGLWIGTCGGLSRFQNGKFSSVTTGQGLPSDMICQILDDDAGNYWMSSFGGLFCVLKAQLDLCASGELKSVKCLICDSSGGLGTLEVSEQGQPAGCRTKDGRLWFATGRGIAMVNPAKVVSADIAPAIKIEEVLVDGRPLPLHPDVEEVSPMLMPDNAGGVRRQLVISPGGHQFEFRYTGLSFSNPTHVVFRYKLEGGDQDWVEAGTRRSAYYTHLLPGDYTFCVLARNADGVWNNQGASMPVRVLPFFWQTWWFKVASRLGGAALLALTVFGVVRSRGRRKLAMLEREHSIEQERARIARDIHDDLGSSLTHMVILSENARARLHQPGSVAASLETIENTCRELTLKLSETVWATSPEHDTLESLANQISKCVHSFLGSSSLHCRLDLPVILPKLSLSSPVRHDVFLAFKESLNNVVKHAHAQSVKISMRVQKNSLLLVIEDDGCGLAGKNSFSPGHGLRNLEIRMSRIGGRCEIETQPGKGTCIRLVLPLPDSGSKSVPLGDL